MKLFNRKLKNRKFLITIESGKNNIGGCTLHIMRGSVIINAKSIDDARDNFQTIFKTEHLYSYKLLHFGHEPDWQIITDIKEV
jgi:hypothetical protein